MGPDPAANNRSSGNPAERISRRTQSALPLAGAGGRSSATACTPFAKPGAGRPGRRGDQVESPPATTRQWGPPFVDGTLATFQSLPTATNGHWVMDLRDAAQQRTAASADRQTCRRGAAEHAPAEPTSWAWARRLTGPKPAALVAVSWSAFRRRRRAAQPTGQATSLMQAFGGIMNVVGEPTARHAHRPVDHRHGHRHVGGAGRHPRRCCAGAPDRSERDGRRLALFETAAC